MNIDRVGIVGTGLASLRVAAKPREAGFAGSLITWDTEDRPPYDRPPLFKNLLDGPVHPPVDRRLSNLVDLGASVIPRLAKGLRRDDGTWFVGETPVGVAIIASESSPRIGVPEAFTLHTAADALRLADLLVPDVRLDTIGAGWAGTGLASVTSSVCEAHLWESSLHALGRALDGVVDSLWFGWLGDARVNLHLDQGWPIGGELPEDLQPGSTGEPTSSGG